MLFRSFSFPVPSNVFRFHVASPPPSPSPFLSIPVHSWFLPCPIPPSTSEQSPPTLDSYFLTHTFAPASRFPTRLSDSSRPPGMTVWMPSVRHPESSRPSPRTIMTTWFQPESFWRGARRNGPADARRVSALVPASRFCDCLPCRSLRDASPGAAANNRFASANPSSWEIWSISVSGVGCEACMRAPLRQFPERARPEPPKRTAERPFAGPESPPVPPQPPGPETLHHGYTED